ncbi:MAG: beta-lactamase family protein [Flavobacteriaceae bacterium]|nr:beta-lactamase family protein [Flavobacteriaceae bacterium]
MFKRFIKIILFLFVLILIYVVYTNYPRLNIISGYSAKNMSSSIFLANRTFKVTDYQDNNFPPIKVANDKVDLELKSATATVYGLMKRKAIYREGLGSALITKGYDENKPFLIPKREKINTNLPFPYGDLEQKDTLFSTIDYKELKNAIGNAFSNNEVKKTRAILVIYKDHIIAEKYAKGFDKNSILLGWSMTKSITATIYGILQKQGELNINDKAPIDLWKDDERSQITINDLLQMNSGLEWAENYYSISDVTKMLFLTEDMSKIQKEKQLIGKQNESWNYSSGTTNLLSGMLREYFNSHQEYLDFWYSNLIDKIGMYSMTIEADLSGNYVGSSYGWATTRDWAKFGLLYLHKGNWNGEQLFNESWVDYVKNPTATSNGGYGGHFWLNAGGKYPDAPKDIYSANGFQGQRVFIIPSKDLVVVRMGLVGSDGFDFNKFLKEIVNSVY